VSASLDLYRLIILAPGHVALADATIEQFLTLSAQQHAPVAWGNVFTQAMVWHAAHTIDVIVSSAGGAASLSPGGSASGTVSSLKTGDEAVGFGAASTGSGPASSISAADAQYLRTPYGQRYLQLRNTRSARAPTVITTMS
jgi:hypothetical protein